VIPDQVNPRDIEPILIDDDVALAELVERWMKVDWLSVDTESDAFFAYREQLCLIQIADGHGIYLVDALAVSLDRLRAVFARQDLETILHAGENDVRLLKSSGKIEIAKLFDTQAATLALGGGQVGLAGLVQDYFGVTLSKKEQRSDWSRRPLSDSQRRYAALDVAYLAGLRDRLALKLKQESKLDAALLLFERLRGSLPAVRKMDLEGFYRVKGYQSLGARERAIFKALFQARERRGDKINRPVFMILGNEGLFQIADLKPRTPSDLEAVRGLSKVSKERFAKEILQAVEQGLKDPSPPPARRVRQKSEGKLRTLDQDLLDALLAWRKQEASLREVEPQVIATARILQAIATEAPRRMEDFERVAELGPRWLRQWGEEVLEIVAKSA